MAVCRGEIRIYMCVVRSTHNHSQFAGGTTFETKSIHQCICLFSLCIQTSLLFDGGASVPVARGIITNSETSAAFGLWPRRFSPSFCLAFFTCWSGVVQPALSHQRMIQCWIIWIKCEICMQQVYIYKWDDERSNIISVLIFDCVQTRTTTQMMIEFGMLPAALFAENQLHSANEIFVFACYSKVNRAHSTLCHTWDVTFMINELDIICIREKNCIRNEKKTYCFPFLSVRWFSIRFLPNSSASFEWIRG